MEVLLKESRVVARPARTTDYRETPRQRSMARTAYWLSASLAFVAAVAAGATVFIPGVLRGVAVMNGSARGTALVVLVVAVPTLALAMLAASRGSVRAQIVWLGAIVYILYNGVLFLFETPFNNLFLLYVTMMSLAIWSTVMVIRAIGVESLPARFSPRLPVRALATYLLAIAVLNFLVWMRAVVPGVLSTSSPAFLEGTGTTTNAIYVGDLVFWLPLAAVAAVWLWRREPWGYLIAGAVLVLWVIEGVGVAVDQWMGHAADPASAVASLAVVPMFAALAVIGLIPLALYIRNLNRAPSRDWT